MRDQVVWLPRPPRRAAIRLGFLLLAAVPTLAIADLMLGEEPAYLDSGQLNPLNLFLPALIAAFALIAVPSPGQPRPSPAGGRGPLRIAAAARLPAHVGRAVVTGG
jgi:hypothetical protein